MTKRGILQAGWVLAGLCALSLLIACTEQVVAPADSMLKHTAAQGPVVVRSPPTGAPHASAPHTGAPHTGAPHTGAPHTGGGEPSAGGDPLEDPVTPDEADSLDQGPYAVSQRNSVQWKRYAALEADLMRGLALEADDVCRELGERSCIRDVHLVALGGNDPFQTSLTRPSEGTLSTTPLVVDRLMLNACGARVRADRAGAAKVFTVLDLSGPAPGPDDPSVDATIETLFRRLLGRDSRPSEVGLIKTLLRGAPDGSPLSAEQFAILSCFVVSSSIEFLFF
ncbi:MAG: hypothetical protein OXR73_24370 [Myxococcales bacterium]|nr:hypothetical protein [Myxococcales bacterium]